MTKREINDFEKEKKEAIKLARDFCYGNDVIAKIKTARNPIHLGNIMTDARRSKDEYQLSS